MKAGNAREARPLDGWHLRFSPPRSCTGFGGDEEPYAEFWDLAMTIRTQRTVNSFSLFVEPRVALHLGAFDRAGPRRRSTNKICGGISALCPGHQRRNGGNHGSGGRRRTSSRSPAPGGRERLRRRHLLRAAGRLHHDEALLKEAVAAWEAIGARFERACTLLLLAAYAEDGARELATLNRPLPATV